MTDFHYMHPGLAEIYDLDSGWSTDREFYLSLARTPGMNILDLGCGTGLLCDAYAAKGHHVTGVDPSAAMLGVASKKAFGKQIEWIQSTSQEFNSNKKFDLIIMTGHAFQVLLTEADMVATLLVMKKHLANNGIIVFESRNPTFDWVSDWDYDIVLKLAEYSVNESRHFVSLKNGLLQFELRYRFPDEELLSKSELRFFEKTEIEKNLNQSGLKVSNLFGGWNEEPFDPENSQEMIFILVAND